MQVVFFVSKENLNRAKDLIGDGPNSLEKKLISLTGKRELGFDEDGSYLVIDIGSEVTKRLAEELLKDYTEIVEDYSEILEKIEKVKETSLKGKYLVFSVKDENLGKVRGIVGASENSLDRQSIIIRDHVSLGVGREGNYVLIDGSEEACKEAQKRLKNVAEELQGEEREKIIQKIKEMEDSALSGVGSIFG